MIKQRGNFELVFGSSRVLALATALVLTAIPVKAHAQTAPDPDTDTEIENLFSKDEQAPPPENKPQTENANDKAADKKNSVEVKDVSDLGKLSEFKDIAVIQRRYMPKTGRFEAFVGPSLVLNDVFFQNFGFDARFAYYFRERYGVELVGMYMTTAQRDVTNELYDKLKVGTTSLLTPRGYVGLDFKWIPVYGKMTWRNRSITPFDLYFSLGLGETFTNQDDSPATLHLGTGQAFFVSKSMAFRWDLSWNFYSAQSKVEDRTGKIYQSSPQVYNNLMITAGVSFFFPEATYR